MDVSRRSLLRSTGVAAAVAATPVSAAVVPTITYRNSSWPVTPAWYEQNTREFPYLADLSRDELQKLQSDLLLKSDMSISERLGGATKEEIAELPKSMREKLAQASLTQTEFRLLAAANNHYDVRTAIDYLLGRPLSDFGFVGYDQVHGNLHTFKCGCKLHVVFDHHRRFEDWSKSNERKHHPHAVHSLCAFHQAYAGHGLDEVHFAVANIKAPVKELV
jgi:hypothetical protein